MRSFILLAVTMGLIAACNTTQSKDRRSAEGRTQSPRSLEEKVEVKLILPGGLTADTALALTHYKYETQWREAPCKIGGAEDEQPFTGRDVVRLELIETCDYRVVFLIGFYEGTTWNSVYEATMIVDPKRDSKSATQVFVERTDDGERLGFPADLKPLLDTSGVTSPTETPTPTPDPTVDPNVGGQTDNTDNNTADLSDPDRNDPDGDGIVEFRIAAGTGSGAWNTEATTVRIKVGQTLRIYNDDSISHQMHTNGAPCPHGNVISTGSYGDCRATRAYNGSPLYDHNSRGSFFIEALP